MLKTYLILFFAVFMLGNVSAAEDQSLEGAWHGTLTSDAGSLRLIFHIDQNSDAPKASIESVDQGGAIIPVDLDVEGKTLRFTNAQYDINYLAEVNGDEMAGTYTQFGNVFPDFKLMRE